MEESKTKLYFRPDRTSRIFPTDCSREELSDALNCHRNTSDKFYQLPIFRDTLLRQVLSPKHSDIAELPEETLTPLPLEVLPLLKAAYDITKVGSNREFRELLAEPDRASDETWAEFLSQLHHRLAQDPEPFPGVTDLEAATRFRHLLFRDKAFTQTMLDDIWNDAFQDRYDQLRQLAHRFPSSIQTQVLANCLTALDESYHYLLNHKVPSSNETPKPSGDALTGLLEAILSHRSTFLEDYENNPHAAYRLPNTCPVPEQTWETYFRTIRKCTSDPDKLRQAREAYCKSDFLPSEAPKAEQKYEYLRFFLDPTPFTVSRQKLEDFLLSLYREQALAIIHRFLINEHQPSEHIDPPFPWQQYLGHSLNRTIQEELSTSFQYILGSFDESIQLAGALSANQGFYMQYELLESAYEAATKTRLPREDLRSLQWMLSRFLEYLDRAWAFLSPKESPFRDTETGLLCQIGSVAERLSSDGWTAFKFFALTDESAIQWYSAEEMTTVLESFHQTLRGSTPRPRNVYLHLSNLMPGLLIIVLHRIIQNAVPALMDIIQTRYPKIHMT